VALLVGAQAPDFTLPGWYHTGPRNFTLSAERGHPVVLAFYPGDQRMVCTRQMCAYSDALGDLELFGAVVWGIAPQDVESHRRFAAGRRLRMPLLADPAKDVARRYGIVGPMGLRRSVFVVNAAGVIAWRHVMAVNLTFPSVAEVAKALAEVGSSVP
jgi:thioredoxin-dependent peroxiredoxin